MEFRVEPEVFARFPGMRIALAVAHGVDNASVPPGLDAAWRAAWAEAAIEGGRYPNAQSHPLVQPWRERFRAMGVSGKQFPSSIEALMRRAMKGDEPFRINPLVDFYNTVSVRHVAPAGGFDLDALDGRPLELRLTRPGDTFTALDAEAPLAVPPGEVAYAVGTTILTRHFVWRQSREATITPATRAVVLLSEVMGELGPEAARRVLDDLGAGLRDYFGATPAGAIADEANPVVRLRAG